MSIEEFCGSPQFKRQQEKTQQAERLLELENEIDEQHFLIDSKQREIESLSKNVKDLQEKENERNQILIEQNEELSVVRLRIDQLEQERNSLRTELKAATKRHNREIEATLDRAQASALADNQERISNLEKKIRKAEQGQREAERRLRESNRQNVKLECEIKGMAESAKENRETIHTLEEVLAETKRMLSEQEEENQLLQAFPGGVSTPKTPMFKLIENDLREELAQEREKSVKYKDELERCAKAWEDNLRSIGSTSDKVVESRALEDQEGAIQKVPSAPESRRRFAPRVPFFLGLP